MKGDSSGNKGQWTQKVRQGRIFEMDRLSVLKGIGPAVENRMKEQGFFEVRHVLAIKNDDQQQRDLVKKVKGFSQKTFKKVYEQLINVHSGSCPRDIDHTRSDNPYLSLFGAGWESKLPQSGTLSAYTSINRMIYHIFTETEKAFLGSKHEATWMVYHDALKLMTGKAAVLYLKENGWYDRLIKPQFGLNDNTKYANRTVGNRPELQPLDYHLNKDIHDGVDEHVIITQHLAEEHPLKFSMRTPKSMLSAYLRLFDPANGKNGISTDARIK